MNPLFACSRCFKRYPFEEIFATSNEDMFCGVIFLFKKYFVLKNANTSNII